MRRPTRLTLESLETRTLCAGDFVLNPGTDPLAFQPPADFDPGDGPAPPLALSDQQQLDMAAYAQGEAAKLRDELGLEPMVGPTPVGPAGAFD